MMMVIAITEKGEKKMAELLPCPFCGEKLVQDKYGNWEHIANDCILSWLDSEYGKIFFEKFAKRG